MSLSDSKRRTLWEEQKGKCLYCKDPLKSYLSAYACLDHIFPKSLGGTDENINLALVCYRCNALKSDFISLSQVIKHFWRMFLLFWKLLDNEKVQRALESGRIKLRKDAREHKYCETCTCAPSNEREKIPNAVFKVGTPPIQAVQRSSRIEAFQRKRDFVQQLKGASGGGAQSSEALTHSA